jgi:integrase
MSLHLSPPFGPQVLRSITRDQLQEFLDGKATTLSRSVVDHLRWDLNAIFNTAQSDGLIDCNPAAALFTPACKPEGHKRVMTPAEIRIALGALDPRERLMFRMAVFDGMRPGEILAVRVGNISDHSIFVDKRVYKGDIDTPKGRKGKRTARTVALSPGTVAELRAWRMMLSKEIPDGYLFPSERNTPLRRDNVWRRDMRPKLATVGMEWATFQVLRRTNASLSRIARIDDKVAADQRGHGLGVSLEVYSISDLQQKIDAVKRLESEVIQ